jgi:hypothetical protein
MILLTKLHQRRVACLDLLLRAGRGIGFSFGAETRCQSLRILALGRILRAASEDAVPEASYKRRSGWCSSAQAMSSVEARTGTTALPSANETTFSESTSSGAAVATMTAPAWR